MCARAGLLVTNARAGDESVGQVDHLLWTKSMYVWHLIDALRITTERLLTARLAPYCEVPCKDENKIAEVGHYSTLPVAVGLATLGLFADQWRRSPSTPTETTPRHGQGGEIGVADLIRRSALEVHHHALDIRWTLSSTV